ncbi:MAG: hemolysin III family protein [Tenacibaculum sp.]|nr:hemolysin III family protein [Tenacibaculum sp.]
MEENLNHLYSKEEERLNVLSHGLGIVLSIIAFPFLVQRAFEFHTFWHKASFIIYGLSLIILYTASTLYHNSKKPKKRRILNIFDHCAIYILIAGSYSPFCLVSLQSKLGWYMFVFVWLFALVGIILKLFFTGKYDRISTLMYILMGWQIVIFIKPLTNSLTFEELFYLVLGGVFYTIGAVFYSVEKIKFNHAIFHVFVLLGSLSHFISIFKI